MRRRNRVSAAGLAATVVALAAGACSVGGGGDDTSAGEAAVGGQVVIATHDSWAAPDALIRQFERESGYRVRIVQSGDAGELTNKLVLSKDSPIADGVYGIDNTFASRALDAGVFADYRSPALPESEYDLPGAAGRLTPVDWSDVCVNIDDTWFEEHDVPKPRTLDDLTKPTYRNLFVTPGATTSSPGFAFLLATIGHEGEGWRRYWEELMANGTKLTSGWTDAYTVDFTAGGGDGDRPIVLSYSSSPPFTIPEGGGRPTTSALLDTCFRQVEYAGVLAGAENPQGAQAFIDFLVSREFQESLPDNMYVYPVNPDAELPELWARWAPPSPDPIEVDPLEIAAKRSEWLRTWGDITTR